MVGDVERGAPKLGVWLTRLGKAGAGQTRPEMDTAAPVAFAGRERRPGLPSKRRSLCREHDSADTGCQFQGLSKAV